MEYNVTRVTEGFHSRKGGGWWFDLPFAYLPWWQDRVKGYGKA